MARLMALWALMGRSASKMLEGWGWGGGGGAGVGKRGGCEEVLRDWQRTPGACSKMDKGENQEVIG
jgi:hypothetical protein